MSNRIGPLTSDLIDLWVKYVPIGSDHYTFWLATNIDGNQEKIDEYNQHLNHIVYVSSNFIAADPALIYGAVVGATLTLDDQTCPQLMQGIVEKSGEHVNEYVGTLIDNFAAYFATREDILHDGCWDEFRNILQHHHDRV